MNVNEKDLEFYLGQEYPVFLRPLSEEDGGGWFAEIPDLPGCMSDGETREEALKNLDEAKRAWITAALEQGQKVPLPKKEEDEYSGKLTLRMPKLLHRELARAAEKERVSLNQLILNLISFGYGALFGKSYRKPACVRAVSGDGSLTRHVRRSAFSVQRWV
ncbi:MAG: type II toxin-antitoxin system HicB family antitoxin [Bacillota bacterium]